jgi:hypothetical protein
MAGGGGNRQDNRQRGNAAQLLEKYKSLARDAQLAGDRVQTEYYLQFADHYFRVLSESRVRFDEQRRGRDEDSEGEDEAELAEAEGDTEVESDERPQRRRGRDRDERFERRERRPNGQARDEQGEAEAEERIAFDALPPAIGSETEAQAEDSGEDEAPRPKRRARRPRADDGDTEVAPAA